MDLEICIDSVEGAIIASKYNAKRVELCAALSEGGLTPSAGMIEAVSKVSTAEVFIMIRPSAGGFIYSDYEIELMERDIRVAKEMGAQGVVFGVLKENNTVAIKQNLYLIETALSLGLGATFHRAIDLCTHPLQALEDIINLGFDRILTSGSKPTAIEGIATIQQLAIASKNRIEIMAGSGINAANFTSFGNSGIHALHCTAKTTVNEELSLDMGPKYVADEEKIKAINEQLKTIS